jgi:hypothetical protein
MNAGVVTAKHGEAGTEHIDRVRVSVIEICYEAETVPAAGIAVLNRPGLDRSH